MRRFVIGAFILFFLWGVLGFFIHIEIKHTIIKKQIKTSLKQSVPEDELIYFEFKTSEFENLTWIKKNEFKYGDGMFDIVSKKIAQGKVLLKCISDKKEKKLFKDLEQLVEEGVWKNNNSKNSNSCFVKLLKTPYYLPNFNLELPIQSKPEMDRLSYLSISEKLALGFKRSIYFPPDYC